MRVAGTVLAAAGLLAVAWALTVWQWQDPFTALYTAHQQQSLETEYRREVAAFVPPTAGVSPAERKRDIRRVAARFRARLERGDAVGRLRVPRLGLDTIVVEGTDSATLTKGPGRYSKSYVPGEGKLVYIAGHRTTYGAPLARIDRLERGDELTIDLPYGTFVYRVSGHAIVPADDVDRLKSRGREEIALQACHPRFFASERYIVYARPVRVTPRGGKPYSASGPA
ncbi:MAG TPA: class D sortase [Gaiellaceae bacterium]|nr:class D sortase [Gaiellaceae bacterium]